MKRIIISLTLSLVTIFAAAQQISKEHEGLLDEATDFFESQEFQSAGEKYSQLLSIYPQHVEFNYMFGVCSINNGSSPEISIKHLEFATKMDATPESFYYLGKAYHLNYDFDKAIAAFNTFKNKVDPKVAEDYDADHQIFMCNNGKNLMNNIKDLVVMDKKVSGEDDFFRYYELTNMGGKLLSIPDELKSKVDKKKKFNGVLFYNGTSNEVYFASYGDKELTGKDLYRSRILPNGKYAEPQKIAGVVNTGYDEDFPFLHPNGKSLYFSSKGHSSMGGYDVFRSEFNDATGKYDTPVNLDFAVNTPDDDILYVTDSLHQEAWFASGRNISSGNYNIYNVKVKGVPMNLTFLKGVFGATYDDDLKVAYIIVRDELTNREVSKVYTDPETGEYIISLYKPGQYKFEVKAKNSQIIHEGYVDVPVSESSAVYSQELSLVQSQGLEKLVIYNDFDAPLDYDIAELQREMLRKKSTLDINADRNALEEEDILVNVDKTIANATLAAGFSEGITIKNVISDSQNDIAQKKKELEEIEKGNSFAFAYALDMQDLAKEKMDESKQIRAAADSDDVEKYENLMKEADKILFEANQYALNSKAAMRVAQRAKKIAEQNRIDINDIENNIKAVIEGEMNNDFDKASNALRWEKDRINAKKGITATTPGELALEESNRVEDQETDVLKDIETLSGEETSLEARINRNTENVANESKKKKKEALQIEGQLLQDELASVQQSLNSNRKEFRILGKEETLLNKEAEFYTNKYIVPETMQVNPISLDSPELYTFDDDYDDLDDELDLAMFERDLNRYAGDDALSLSDITDNDIVSNNDPIDDSKEDLAINNDPVDAEIKEDVVDNNPTETKSDVINDVADNTTIKTDNTIADTNVDNTLAEVTETEIENGNDLKTDTSTTENNDSNTMDVAFSEEKKKESYIELASINDEISTLERDIQNFENGDSDSFTAEEIYSKRVALEEKQVVKKEIKSSVITEPISEEKSLAIYKEIEPSYRQNIQSIISENENEIDQSLRILDYKKTVKTKLKTVIDGNQTRLNTITDEDEIAELSEENTQYQEAYDKLNMEIYDVDNFKAAFESENKDIVESEEIIAIKLNDQVRLTNQFIAGIDEVLDETNKEIRNSSSSEEKDMLKGMVVDLAEERDQAQLKLENYEEDLALSTSAEDFDMNSLKTSTSNEPKGDDPEEDGEIETPINGGSFNDIFADVKEIKPEDAFYSDMFVYFVDETQGTKFAVDNMAEVEELENDIYELEMRYVEAADDEKGELDQQIEKKFTALSKLELRNYARMHRFTEKEMKENAIKIDSLKTVIHSDIDKRIVLDELKKLTKAIDFESVELENKRSEIPDSNDFIEQSFLARQAFGLETSIIQKQRKMIAIYENIEILNSLSDDDVRDMNAGRYEAEIPEYEIEINSDIDWTLLNDELDIPELSTSSYIADLKSGNSERAADLVYMDHLRLIELKLADQTRSIENRNSLQEEYNTIEQEIEELEYAIANTKKKKDREVLEVELELLRAKADVIYAQIAKLNEDISKNESEISKLLEVDVADVALNQDPKEVKTDTSEIKLDTAGTDAPNKDVDPNAINDIADNNTTKVAQGENQTDNEVKTAIEDKTTDVAVVTNPVVDNKTVVTNPKVETEESGYDYDDLYNFPEVLTENIFRMHPSKGRKRKIPTNVKLPTGTVYKVQVGAFRNPIDSKVFDGFSPVTGEVLNNGITRYTAGLFINYDNAEEAKQSIRALGYSDAFIVKFVDGKRVSISGLETGEIAQNTNVDTTPVTNEVVSESTTTKTTTNEVVDAQENKTNTKVDTKVDTAEYSEDLLEAAKTDETGTVAQNYYNSFQDAATAKSVESVDGVFFTVQIGVYSRPVPASELNNIDPLNAELLDGGKYRYSTGIYNNVSLASARKAVVAQSGFSDAFVTAYYNGKRITVAKAKELLAEGKSAASSNSGQTGAVTNRTSRNGSITDMVTESNDTTAADNAGSTDENRSANTTTNNTTPNTTQNSGTVSMELETPVVVKTTVNERSDGEPIKMIQMEYDVLLVSTQLEEIPEMVRRAMEEFGAQWEIKAVRKGEFRLVYTKKVNSLQEARNMMKELEAFGVVEPEIRAFRRDKN